jgi:probable phosphoglycerate mutase
MSITKISRMLTIILIRHAMTDSAGKRLTGRKPGILLNNEGREQSRQLSQRLASFTISAIYSSPLERAIETADILGKDLCLNINVSEDFQEIDFGKWTDIPIEEIRDEPEFFRFNNFRSGTRIPGGELMVEAQVRIIRGIEKLKERHQNETVAVISHADVIRSAIAYYLGVHIDMMSRIMVSPASMSILELYDDTAHILLVNGTS